MKNIYVLSTDKLSRLIGSRLKLSLKDIPILGFDAFRTYNIYITSDEEIKKRDWVLLSDGRVVKTQTVRKDSLWFNDGLETMPKYCKKIILTTDQDLIKDGVQAIDDEFLEWFIKNPSCEEVKVEEVKIINYSFPRGAYNKYKIIIPKEDLSYTTKMGITVSDEMIRATMIPKEYFGKEESKQPLQKLVDDGYADNIVIKDDMTYEFKPTPIQKSLEEAAKKYINNDLDLYESLVDGHISYNIGIDLLNKLFIAGAKWQQERSYSEEEVLGILRKIHSIEKTSKMDTWITKWFEQFKKK